MTPAQRRAPITIAVSTRSVGVVLGVVAIFWLGRQLADLLVVLLLAVVLATAVDRPVGWLQRRGLPRSIGVLAIYAVLGLVLLGLIAAFVPLVNADLLILRDELPGYADRVERFIQRLAPNAASRSSLSFATLAVQLSSHAEGLAGQLTGISLAAGRVAVLGLATVVIAYFLAVDPSIGPRLLARFAPPSVQERAIAVASVVHRRIGAWVRGQALVALTFGLAMGLGLWVLGVPYAVSLGVVAAVLELVPYAGGAVTVLLAVLAAATMGLPEIIGVVVLYVALVAAEAHVVAPIFLGRFVGLPSVAVLVALVAGAELLGLTGVLLAVPLTVIAWAIVDEVWPAPGRSGPRAEENARLPATTGVAGVPPDAADIEASVTPGVR